MANKTNLSFYSTILLNQDLEEDDPVLFQYIIELIKKNSKDFTQSLFIENVPNETIFNSIFVEQKYEIQEKLLKYINLNFIENLEHRVLFVVQIVSNIDIKAFEDYMILWARPSFPKNK